jgi:hypothetical protein
MLTSASDFFGNLPITSPIEAQVEPRGQTLLGVDDPFVVIDQHRVGKGTAGVDPEAQRHVKLLCFGGLYIPRRLQSTTAS